MKKTLCIFGVLVSCVCRGLETFIVTENDCYLKNGGDSDYTHGTKLEAVTDSGYHFMLSQTMYAPPDLTLRHHMKGDRPYAGMLIGGVGREFFEDAKSPWTHYGEFDFGVIGPAAMCKDTQTLVHKLLGCTKPRGWDDQLHNEVVANAQWWTKYHWMPVSWFAVVPKAGVAAGTIEDFAEIGFDAKLGWNICKKANNDIIFSAPRGGGWLDRISAYAFCGVSERYYLYNHILEGSMLNHKDDDLKADMKPFVTEFRAGAVLQLDRFYATYYCVFRTDEYKGQQHTPDFGGIGIGWTW